MIYLNNKIYKVGIYLRLSDEDKNKKNKSDNSESIKNQRYLLLEEIEKRKNFILVDEYCDEDLSGAGTYRPEFERMIKDCESKKLDIILCKSQSRFSRDMEIIEKYLHNKFIEWNIRFISLADNADTDNIGNKKARQINGLVNEWYLEDVSNNIRSAFNAKMKRGELISPFAPYGYEISPINNNKLIIDTTASDTVKKIFNLYLIGYGPSGIAQYLNEKNIPSPSLHKYLKGIKLNIISTKERNKILWSPTSTKTILTNEVYLGHLIQGKRTTISYKNHNIKKKDKQEWIRYENTHEAIITKEIFNKVQKEITKRKRQSNHIKKSHIFSGKVFCTNCNSIFRKKNTKSHEYLVCSKANNIYHDCSNTKSIRYDKLENIILTEINKKIKLHCNIDKIKSNTKNKIIFNNNLNYLTTQKEEILKKISQNKRYLKKLYETRIDNLINDIEFKDLLTEYNTLNKLYNEQLISIDKDINLYKTSNKTTTPTLLKNKEFTKLNRFIIEEFIDIIYIDKTINNERNIKIKWNF